MFEGEIRVGGVMILVYFLSNQSQGSQHCVAATSLAHQASVFCNSLASCKYFIVGNRIYRMVSQIHKQNVPNIYKFWKKFPRGYYGPKPARLLVHYHYHHNADKQTPHGTHILCPIFPLKCSLGSKTQVKNSLTTWDIKGVPLGGGVSK